MGDEVDAVGEVRGLGRGGGCRRGEEDGFLGVVGEPLVVEVLQVGSVRRG